MKNPREPLAFTGIFGRCQGDGCDGRSAVPDDVGTDKKS